MIDRFASARALVPVLLLAALAVPSSSAAQAVLSVSPASVSVQTHQGTNAPSQSVQVRNAGKGALKWTVSQPSANWLSVSPTSGTNSGTLGLSFRTSSLAAGDHQTTFRVDSNTGSAITVTVRVSIVANAVAPPPSEPSPTPPPPNSGSFNGTTIYVSPSGSDTNSGTQSSPVRTIGRGVQLAYQVNASGQAARVLMAAGTYRESVVLNTGQKTTAPMVLEGAGATTVLSGSDVFSAWVVQSDGSLVHHWPHKWGMKPLPNGWDGYWNHDGHGAKRDVLRRSESVYVNGQPLRGVLSLSQLEPGTFFVNESTERLHVRLPTGMLPTQATIEAGTRLTPMTINGQRNLTLRNFAIARSRGAVQDTAIRITNSHNIALEDMSIRWMAYQAIGGAYNTTVRIRRSSLSDNGVMALGQLRDIDVIIEDSEIARNNWRGWAAEMKGWDSVHKWSGVRDGIVRRTRFVNNQGNGFWIDTDNKRITLENSLISGQGLTGVWLENNQGPITIAGNRICNNVQSGVADAQSDRVTLRNNQIWGTARWNIMHTGHYSGRTMKDWQTGQSITNRSLYWTFDGNTVAGHGSEGWLWWHTDFNAPGAWALIRSTFVVLNNNRWHHSGRTTGFRLPQGAVTHTGFVSDLLQASGNHEKNSLWQTPSGLSCTLP